MKEAAANMAVLDHDIAPTPPIGLAVVRQLLARLHAAGIVYCHWKSNEHLGPGLEGLTDLDVLVDRRQHLALERILAEVGFKRFTATPLRAYPAVEDYLGFDQSTGRLAHLHLHYQLTLGQPHLKGYRLPWEARVLSGRLFDEAHGVHVADPTMELVLLLVRGALKRRLRDPARRLFGKRAGGDYRREFDWLLARVDVESVCRTATDLLGRDVDAPLRALLADPESPQHQKRFAAAARPALRRCRTYGPLSAQFRAMSRELQRVAGVLNRRALNQPVPLRRTLPRGGVVVAFLGSDGSGKSSLVKETVAWLGAKLDVLPIYFGSGDGPGSLYRLPFQLARRGLETLTGKVRGESPPDLKPGRRHRGFLRSAALLPWALTLSLEKRSKLRRMIRARNRGMIVVCDRYAQAAFPGFNDGPLLHHLHASRWRIGRALAAWEARPYTAANLDPPDLVIKLIATPDVALSRRPEMSAEEIRRRIDAVRSLQFPSPARVIEINSDARLEQVVLNARRVVWEGL